MPIFISLSCMPQYLLQINLCHIDEVKKDIVVWVPFCPRVKLEDIGTIAEESEFSFPPQLHFVFFPSVCH